MWFLLGQYARLVGSLYFALICLFTLVFVPVMLICGVRILKFLRAIRAIPSLTNTPVAIVTGDYYLDDAQSNEIKELGAELRYKPLWLEELVTLARELLNIPVRD